MTTAAATSLLATALASFTVPPVSDDGEAQWRAVAARVDALVHEPHPRVNVDPQEAADRVLASVRALCEDAALYRRFKVIAATGEFDFGAFERLLQHAPALWYARHQQLHEERQSAAVVPEAVVRRAVALRDAMARLARYHLEDHAEEGALVAALSASHERSVLANELLTLAELYARNADAVSSDRRFVAADEAEARALSSQIRRSLGERYADGVRWTDRVAVLWSLIQHDYNELRALGLWLLRARPEEARARLPPLVLRTGRRPKSEDADAPAEDDAPVAGASPANDAPVTAPVANDAAPATPTATKPQAAKKNKGR
jgi:hypothetical protein